MSTSDTPSSPYSARHMHIVTLACKDETHAQQCLQALARYGRPDAQAFHCQAYEFGLLAGAPDTVILVERWQNWADLDALLTTKVIPALPVYNALLKRPFDPGQDTRRINLNPDS